MIILYLLQLFIGTIFILVLFGQLLNIGQKVFRLTKMPTLLIVTTILIIIFYCMIAYYYSECVDIYSEAHKGKAFTLTISFLLLVFMLYGPAKYADIKEQSEQIVLSGTIATIFFIVIRFFPILGDVIFGWLPILIWV